EIINDEPSPLRQYNPEAPEEVERVCQRAMAKEPGNRYSTATDFATDLRKLLPSLSGSGQSVVGGSVAVASVAAEPVSSIHRWGPAALATLGCGILAIAAYSFILSKPSPIPEPVPVVPPPPSLQIHFQKKDSQTYSPNLADAALPLQVGDKLQFHVDQLS